MTTSSRIRPQLDLGRLRYAMQGPGADTRTWCFYARVDDDEDSVRWDETLGWCVDVSVVGGPLDQEGPVVCRMPFGWMDNGGMCSMPPVRGAHVVVVVPDGEILVPPAVIGFVPDPDFKPPSEINGQTIDEAFALANVIWLTPLAVQWATGAVTWTFPEATLGDKDASQAYVRGNDQLDALKSFMDALDAFVAAISTAVPAPPNGALTVAEVLAAAAVFRPQIAQAKTALQQALSTRIKGV